MLKVSLLLQARERVTGPLRQIRSGVRSMVRDSEGQVTRLGRRLDWLGRQGQRAGSLIASGLRRGASIGFTALTAIARRGMSTVGRILRRGLQFGAIGATAGLSYLLWQLTGGVIATTSKFEQFQVALESTEGSAAAARRALAWVQNFAQTTPYEVDEVMAAFVRLRAFGIDPTDGTLRSLGDAASGMNKTLTDAVEMLADATSFQFERLREFGVTATQQGNRVTLRFRQNGRDMSRTVQKTAGEVSSALRQILGGRFEGLMDRQSRTLTGLWSNLSDQWTRFQLMVGQAGFFDLVKSKIQQILDRVNAMAQNGQLQAWAQRVSRFLEAAFTRAWNFFTQTDWGAVAGRLRVVGDAIMFIARAIGAIASLADKVRDVFNFLSLGGRGEAIAGARGEYAGGLFRRAIDQELARRQAARGGGQSAMDRVLTPMLTPSRPNANEGRFNFRRYLNGPVGMAPPIRQQSAAPARPQEVRVRNEVGGRIGLTVQESPLLSARLNRLEAANRNVPIDVTRGRVGPG